MSMLTDLRAIRLKNLLIILALLLCSYGLAETVTSPSTTVAETAWLNELKEDINALITSQQPGATWESLFPPRVVCEKVVVATDTLQLHFSGQMASQPIRFGTINELNKQLIPLALKYSDLPVEYLIRGKPVQYYIPEYFRLLDSGQPVSALPTIKPKVMPGLVQRRNLPYPPPTHGLLSRYIALWASHGWYYEAEKMQRWEWQRPRLFTTCEDLESFSYIVPFLIPMLEKAGAIVFYPRERDIQTLEIVVDNGDKRRHKERGIYNDKGWLRWKTREGPGFKNDLAPFPEGVNPHQLGNYRECKTAPKAKTWAKWIPNIPQTGDYAVYISFNSGPDRASDAHYQVKYYGGKADFLVNQKMGGNTWVYLGTFRFQQGRNPESGCVILTNESQQPATTVCADAVKFGGGMGSCLRNGSVSGYPRYAEGALYWMQYAGADPSLVWELWKDPEKPWDDYTKDYSGRPEFVNFLHGAPNGPNKDRNYPGLGIPIDLSFAFHTDAGITTGVVGTLMIYRTKDQLGNEQFPDGRPRTLNRELADIMQSQVVLDIRSKYSSSWVRRQLWEANYAEVRRPNVPSCLLELLSHQNFNDMKYSLAPRFRFDVARAIYKGMLRFLAREYGFEPVVAPLPPTGLVVQAKPSGEVKLSWQPQPDPLEPTADPTGYVVYRRENKAEGFDQGTYTSWPYMEITDLKPEKIYSFRVTAANEGGESFPSETLCVHIGSAESRKALIVYGFYRLGPPSYVHEQAYAGFTNDSPGVDYRWGIHQTGAQYDFDPKSKFHTNDAPGHGASYADLENKVMLGNTFDYTVIHGESLAKAGWAFDSASHKAIEAGEVVLKDYDFVDWVLGLEKAEGPHMAINESGVPDKMTVEFKTFSPGLQEKVKEYLTGGGVLFVSGAFVGYDLAASPYATDNDNTFLKEVLYIDWQTNHASRDNQVYALQNSWFKDCPTFHFSRGLGEDIYPVAVCDIINPQEGAETLLRYQEGRFGAAIGSQKPPRLVVFGFPFETIISEEARDYLMKQILAALIAGPEQ